MVALNPRVLRRGPSGPAATGEEGDCCECLTYALMGATYDLALTNGTLTMATPTSQSWGPDLGYREVRLIVDENLGYGAKRVREFVGCLEVLTNGVPTGSAPLIQTTNTDDVFPVVSAITMGAQVDGSVIFTVDYDASGPWGGDVETPVYGTLCLGPIVAPPFVT